MPKKKKSKEKELEVAEFIEKNKILEKLKIGNNENERTVEKGKIRKQRRWKAEEVEDLKKGVEKHGKKWRKIWLDEAFNFGDRIANDLSNKWTHMQKKESEKEKPPVKKKRKKRVFWTQEETLHLLRGVERHGCRWRKILKDPDLKFDPSRTPSSLWTRSDYIKTQNRAHSKRRFKLRTLIDLNPHHAIIIKAIAPWQAFVKLKVKFKQTRYMLMDLESKEVHVYSAKGKITVKPSTSEQRKRVRKLIEQLPPSTLTEKASTNKTYYYKVLFWKTKMGVKPNAYRAYVPRTSPRNSYLKINKKKLTMEDLDEKRKNSRKKKKNSSNEVLKISAGTKIEWKEMEKTAAKTLKELMMPKPKPRTGSRKRKRRRDSEKASSEEEDSKEQDLTDISDYEMPSKKKKKARKEENGKEEANKRKAQGKKRKAEANMQEEKPKKTKMSKEAKKKRTRKQNERYAKQLLGMWERGEKRSQLVMAKKWGVGSDRIQTIWAIADAHVMSPGYAGTPLSSLEREPDKSIKEERDRSFSPVLTRRRSRGKGNSKSPRKLSSKDKLANSDEEEDEMLDDKHTNAKDVNKNTKVNKLSVFDFNGMSSIRRKLKVCYTFHAPFKRLINPGKFSFDGII